MKGLRFLSVGLVVCASFFPSTSGQETDASKAAQVLQQAFRQTIAQNADSVACISVARGEPYEEPPKDDPGRLGAFPNATSAKEKKAADSPQFDPAHRDYAPESYGSGVAIDAKGLLLTNYHVVRDARKVYVRFKGGKGSYANIHAADPRSDLAVLKLLDESLTLKPIKLGDADKLARADFLLVLAHSFVVADEGPSVYRCILSNVRRPRAQARTDPAKLPLHHFSGLLQLDFAVQAGTMSGGAILNLQGEMVGLGTSMAAVGDPAAIPTLALPINPATKRIIEVLKTGAEVEYGFLGVKTEDVPASELSGLGIQDGGAVRISEEVAAGAPAAKAQLRKGDILLSINDARIRDGGELFWTVSTSFAGASVDLLILRDRLRQTKTVKELAKLGPMPGGIATKRSPVFRGMRVDYVTVLIGQITPARIDLQEKVAAALKQGGVVVTEVQADSAAARAGLQIEDVITHVNERPVESPADFAREMQKATGPVQLTLLPIDNQPRKLRLE